MMSVSFCLFSVLLLLQLLFFSGRPGTPGGVLAAALPEYVESCSFQLTSINRNYLRTTPVQGVQVNIESGCTLIKLTRPKFTRIAFVAADPVQGVKIELIDATCLHDALPSDTPVENCVVFGSGMDSVGVELSITGLTFVKDLKSVAFPREDGLPNTAFAAVSMRALGSNFPFVFSGSRVEFFSSDNREIAANISFDVLNFAEVSVELQNTAAWTVTGNVFTVHSVKIVSPPPPPPPAAGGGGEGAADGDPIFRVSLSIAFCRFARVAGDAAQKTTSIAFERNEMNVTTIDVNASLRVEPARTSDSTPSAFGRFGGGAFEIAFVLLASEAMKNVPQFTLADVQLTVRDISIHNTAAWRTHRVDSPVASVNIAVFASVWGAWIDDLTNDFAIRRCALVLQNTSVSRAVDQFFSAIVSTGIFRNGAYNSVYLIENSILLLNNRVKIPKWGTFGAFAVFFQHSISTKFFEFNISRNSVRVMHIDFFPPDGPPVTAPDWSAGVASTVWVAAVVFYTDMPERRISNGLFMEQNVVRLGGVWRGRSNYFVVKLYIIQFRGGAGMRGQRIVRASDSILSFEPSDAASFGCDIFQMQGWFMRGDIDGIIFQPSGRRMVIEAKNLTVRVGPGTLVQQQQQQQQRLSFAARSLYMVVVLIYRRPMIVFLHNEGQHLEIVRTSIQQLGDGAPPASMTFSVLFFNWDIKMCWVAPAGAVPEQANMTSLFRDLHIRFEDSEFNHRGTKFQLSTFCNLKRMYDSCHPWQATFSITNSTITLANAHFNRSSLGLFSVLSLTGPSRPFRRTGLENVTLAVQSVTALTFEVMAFRSKATWALSEELFVKNVAIRADDYTLPAEGAEALSVQQFAGHVVVLERAVQQPALTVEDCRVSVTRPRQLPVVPGKNIMLLSDLVYFKRPSQQIIGLALVIARSSVSLSVDNLANPDVENLGSKRYVRLYLFRFSNFFLSANSSVLVQDSDVVLNAAAPRSTSPVIFRSVSISLVLANFPAGAGVDFVTIQRCHVRVGDGIEGIRSESSLVAVLLLDNTVGMRARELTVADSSIVCNGETAAEGTGWSLVAVDLTAPSSSSSADPAQEAEQRNLTMVNVNVSLCNLDAVLLNENVMGILQLARFGQILAQAPKVSISGCHLSVPSFVAKLGSMFFILFFDRSDGANGLTPAVSENSPYIENSSISFADTTSASTVSTTQIAIIIFRQNLNTSIFSPVMRSCRVDVLGGTADSVGMAFLLLQNPTTSAGAFSDAVNPFATAARPFLTLSLAVTGKANSLRCPPSNSFSSPSREQDYDFGCGLVFVRSGEQISVVSIIESGEAKTVANLPYLVIDVDLRSSNFSLAAGAATAAGRIAQEEAAETEMSSTGTVAAGAVPPLLVFAQNARHRSLIIQQQRPGTPAGKYATAMMANSFLLAPSPETLLLTVRLTAGCKSHDWSPRPIGRFGDMRPVISLAAPSTDAAAAFRVWQCGSDLTSAGDTLDRPSFLDNSVNNTVRWTDSRTAPSPSRSRSSTAELTDTGDASRSGPGPSSSRSRTLTGASGSAAGGGNRGATLTDSESAASATQSASPSKSGSVSLLPPAVKDYIPKSVVSVITLAALASAQASGAVMMKRQKTLIRLTQGCGVASSGRREVPGPAESPLQLKLGDSDLQHELGVLVGNPVFCIVFTIVFFLAAKLLAMSAKSKSEGEEGKEEEKSAAAVAVTTTAMSLDEAMCMMRMPGLGWIPVSMLAPDAAASLGVVLFFGDLSSNNLTRAIVAFAIFALLFCIVIQAKRLLVDVRMYAISLGLATYKTDEVTEKEAEAIVAQLDLKGEAAATAGGVEREGEAADKEHKKTSDGKATTEADGQQKGNATKNEEEEDEEEQSSAFWSLVEAVAEFTLGNFREAWFPGRFMQKWGFMFDNTLPRALPFLVFDFSIVTVAMSIAEGSTDGNDAPTSRCSAVSIMAVTIYSLYLIMLAVLLRPVFLTRMDLVLVWGNSLVSLATSILALISFRRREKIEAENGGVRMQIPEPQPDVELALEILSIICIVINMIGLLCLLDVILLVRSFVKKFMEKILPAETDDGYVESRETDNSADDSPSPSAGRKRRKKVKKKQQQTQEHQDGETPLLGRRAEENFFAAARDSSSMSAAVPSASPDTAAVPMNFGGADDDDDDGDELLVPKRNRGRFVRRRRRRLISNNQSKNGGGGEEYYSEDDESGAVEMQPSPLPAAAAAAAAAEHSPTQQSPHQDSTI